MPYAGRGLGANEMGFNGKQRDWVKVDLGGTIRVKPCNIGQYIASMTIELDFYGGKQPKKAPPVLNTDKLSEACHDEFGTNTVFSVEQLLVLYFKQVEKCPLLEGRVVEIELIESRKDPPLGRVSVKYGRLAANSVIKFGKKENSSLQLSGRNKDKSANTAIISPDFDFKMMGIGGLDKEFSAIFRRAFASRVFPPELVDLMGMKHVRGILLFGPPGTGKTLMARQIGKMLHAREPKIIHGPEILDKYVGQSEANVRQLFADAEAEEKKMGINSALHIIIFDEIDAICRTRGSLSGSTGVHDTVVNQLLAKIDGVEQLNNILLIGMTNRKDMIDEALLRPGRLEVQMEIGLPDEKGRIEILQIHTAKQRENKKLDEDVDIDELARKTRNFSGAELEGLVRSATSTAMNRIIQAKDRVEVDYKEAETLRITMADFQFALENDVKPAFGISEEELDSYIKNGIIPWGPDIDRILSRGKVVIKQTIESSHNHLISMLLKGPAGSGKTALAVKIAQESNFPFVKVISPEKMIGFHESAKCQTIKKVFEDAYKSPLSCVVIDDFERLLDYVNIGPRFSNLVLQALLVLLRKQPPTKQRLLIIATTSLTDDVIMQLGIEDAFNFSVYVPILTEGSQVIAVLEQLNLFDENQLDVLGKELKGKRLRIGIKKLIALADASCQSKESVDDLITILQTEANLK